MLFKIVLLFTCCLPMVYGRCNLTSEPLELIDCLSHMSTVLLGLAKNDLGRVCRSTSLIAQCAQGYLYTCIGEQIGIAAFKEIISLSTHCCPNRNSPNCSIRDAALQNQQCFAADSLVTLANGQQKIIAHLQPGDRLLAYNNQHQRIISTPLITFMHYQPQHFALFKHITTATGRQISLTSSHLLSTSQHGYLMAKDLQHGMSIMVMNEEGELMEDRVLNVTEVVKQGYIAPLTEEGTVMVNGVAASCYATIKSHRLAHAVLAPMRWWYSWFGVGMKSSEMSVGVHWFPKMLYDITTFFLPSIIHQ